MTLCFVYLQAFEADDYRNVRFTNSTRYVNKNWGSYFFFHQCVQTHYIHEFFNILVVLGINLIAEVPPKECTERVVCCDGGDPHLGHPKVYINLVRNCLVIGCVQMKVIY